MFRSTTRLITPVIRLAPLLLVICCSASSARSGDMWQDIRYLENWHFASLDFVIRNNDTIGYDHYEFYNLLPLAQALYELPHNRAQYDSLQEMTARWDLVVVVGGTTWNGWYGEVNDLNPARLVHGQPYTPWYIDFELASFAAVPLPQLDADGNGWSLSDPDDWQIEFGPMMDRAAAGFNKEGGSAPTPGYSYRLVPVPEPSSLSLLLLAPAFLLRRTRLC